MHQAATGGGAILVKESGVRLHDFVGRERFPAPSGPAQTIAMAFACFSGILIPAS